VSSSHPRNVVLLAAGRGARLSPLTDGTHKSLLPVAGGCPLQRIIEQILVAKPDQVVVVTGYQHEVISAFVHRYSGTVIQTVYNALFLQDNNILSAELGVNALRHPELGYLIVETDIVIAPAGWRCVLDVGAGRESFWVTRGVYSVELTGGALNVGPEGIVTGLVYAPEYDATYDGWQKLLGVLFVGADQVAADRALRRRAVARSIGQYYMMPWVHHLDALPSRVKNLGQVYAASYNDLATYRKVDREFAEF
jgi:CTP:molybdopterin cytidylyltransferase MocA